MRHFTQQFLTTISLMLTILLAGKSSTAQVNLYGFNASVGTYTPITGTPVFTGAWHDNTPVSVDLGFDFTFNGQTYTSCYISPNGFITFGSIMAGTNYTPISSTAAY